MSSYLRVAIHANFKHICRKQKTRKEKESKKSTFDSEERVLKINAAIKEYKYPFAFSSTRKSDLKNIVSGKAVGSERLNDMLEGKAIRKEHLDDFLNKQFFEEKISFGDSVKKLNLKTSSNGGKRIVCKKNPRNDHSEDRRKSILLIVYRQ